MDFSSPKIVSDQVQSRTQLYFQNPFHDSTGWHQKVVKKNVGLNCAYKYSDLWIPRVFGVALLSMDLTKYFQNHFFSKKKIAGESLKVPTNGFKFNEAVDE